MKKILSEQHKRNISRGMLGKNRGRRSPEARAAISTTKLLGRDHPGWQRAYRAKVKQLRLATQLAG